MSALVDALSSSTTADTEAAREHAARVEEKKASRRALWAERDAQVRAL